MSSLPKRCDNLADLFFEVAKLPAQRPWTCRCGTKNRGKDLRCGGPNHAQFGEGCGRSREERAQ